ncbi:MAG TPA: ATP-binding protein [Gammaproteobacteria bacterium]|jgi:hypothetical protein
MKEIQLVDVTIHIDRDSDDATRSEIEKALRAAEGVISVHMPAEERHLVVVEYNPDAIKSLDLLHIVQGFSRHADLIGL